MPAIKLTALSVPSLPPGEYRDALMPGLILRVGLRRRVWQYRARVGARQPRTPLGYFPALGLADAREAARSVALRIESGAPPRLRRRTRDRRPFSRSADSSIATRRCV